MDIITRSTKDENPPNVGLFKRVRNVLHSMACRNTKWLLHKNLTATLRAQVPTNHRPVPHLNPLNPELILSETQIPNYWVFRILRVKSAAHTHHEY